MLRSKLEGEGERERGGERGRQGEGEREREGGRKGEGETTEPKYLYALYVACL